MILMNMFSSFDPASFLNPIFLSMWGIIILMKPLMSKSKIIKKKLMKMMEKEVKPNMESKNQKSSTSMFTALFIFLMMINLGGLTPSSFSLTTHMSINLPLALIMWISTNTFSMTKKNKKMLSHMVPTGTPMPLAPFMSLIELVSNLIRPITLSVRLTANMVAGHILISLMENFVMNLKPNMLISFMMASTLTILETGVSIIQAYVFSILVSLYFSENH